ncbi:hypothetical protein DRW31_19680, partial [Shigella dysenteriae]|nr:hypothetical protein [Shigella dysenteriae]
TTNLWFLLSTLYTVEHMVVRRRQEQRQNAAPYQWKKPERVRWKNTQTQVNGRTQRCCDIGLIR